MKKIAIAIASLFFACSAQAATTYYVDLACPDPGNGLSASCTSGGATNPKSDIASGIALLSSSDDILSIRGIHSTHDSGHCPGSTTGLYQTNKITISGKSGASGHPIIIQPYGYPSSPETVFIDGTADPGTWTQCSVCNSGVCNGVPGTCSETWWIVGSGTHDKAEGAQKSDGTPTFRVTAIGNMTNATAGYTNKVCSFTTWMRCVSANDCPATETCTGTTAEIDSFSEYTSGGHLFVRWAADPNAMSPKPQVFENSDGNAFMIQNSSWVTVRGFNFRCHTRESVSVDDGGGAVSNIVVSDNRSYYTCHSITGSGPAYGMAARGASPVTFDGNTMAYSADEGLHTRGLSGAGPTIMTITNNWIHDQGDQHALGPGCDGTPSGIILALDGSAADGNNTGSVISGNLIQRQFDGSIGGGSAGRGIIVEDKNNNFVIRDNIFDSPAGPCIKLDGTTSANSNQIYNNIFKGCGASFGGPAVLFSGTATGNSLYNNTSIDSLGGFIDLNGAGTFTDNLIRNNIAYSSGSVKQVNWTDTTSSNKFEYNLVVTSANPAVTWLNTNRACSAISAAGTGNIDNCPSPVFVNSGSNDFHIQSTSPAKDAGTATGMPSGRTTDINNTVADDHGLVSYADANIQVGAAWDIGIDEFSTGGGGGNPHRVIISSLDDMPVGSYICYIKEAM
jgi:hypothetical protein